MLARLLRCVLFVPLAMSWLAGGLHAAPLAIQLEEGFGTGVGGLGAPNYDSVFFGGPDGSVLTFTASLSEDARMVNQTYRGLGVKGFSSTQVNETEIKGAETLTMTFTGLAPGEYVRILSVGFGAVDEGTGPANDDFKLTSDLGDYAAGGIAALSDLGPGYNVDFLSNGFDMTGTVFDFSTLSPDDDYRVLKLTAEVVPEPTSVTLMGLGLGTAAALGLRRRRKWRRAAAAC